MYIAVECSPKYIRKNKVQKKKKKKQGADVYSVSFLCSKGYGDSELNNGIINWKTKNWGGRGQWEEAKEKEVRCSWISLVYSFDFGTMCIF